MSIIFIKNYKVGRLKYNYELEIKKKQLEFIDKLKFILELDFIINLIFKLS